jgi:tRNA-2-methylthio-N6-dimethylallyladenosine synthase
MLRRYDRDGYLDCVRRLRRAVPGIALSTDLIVGFPGETEADFAETLSLVDAAGFDDAYTFIYSARDGTPATRLPDAVPADVSGERLARLVEAVRAGARRRNLALVGGTQEVLVEGPARRGELLQSRTRTNKIVLLEGSLDLVGRYLDVKLTGTTGSTFSGMPVAKRPAITVLV